MESNLEQKYDKKIIETKTVVAGLKFIAENPNLTQEELNKGLLELGCNFTFEDIQRQFPEKVSLFEGMNKGIAISFIVRLVEFDILHMHSLMYL